MAIELPRFEDTFCRLVSLCSLVSDESAQALPQEDLDLTASYNAGAGKALLRLLWEHKEKHLHIDLALRSAFGSKPPQATTRLPEFRKTFDTFRSASGTAIVQGSFIVPTSSLPPTGGLIFTANSAIRLKVSKSEIELTGASLRLRNAPVNYIRWDLGKDTVFLEVFARRASSVTDTYLQDAFQYLNAAVDQYILGKKTDDKTSD